MKEKLPSVLAAAFGGASPSLLNLAMLLTGHNYARFEIGTYCLGILVWAFMGAMVGWIVYEKNLKKAFYLGVGLPAFIQASIANFSEANKATDRAASAFPSLVQSAVAAEPPTTVIAPAATASPPSSSVPAPPATNRILVIGPAAQGVSEYRLRWTFTDGKIEEIQLAREKTNRLVLPPNVREIVVQGENLEPAKVRLSELVSPTNHLELRVRHRTWSGLERALGMRGVKDFAADVKVQK